MSEQELTAAEWWDWQVEVLHLCNLRIGFTKEEIDDNEFYEWWTKEQAIEFCEHYDRIRELIDQFPQEERATALELAFRAFYHGRNTHGMIDKVRRRDGRKKGGKNREGWSDYPEAWNITVQLIDAGELKKLTSVSSKASAIVRTLDIQKIKRPGKRQVERWLNKLGQ
jgi:hypothetical protein